MQEEFAVAEGAPQLSQGARVLNTFVAPSRTFADILRSANCWLPIVLMAIMSILFAYGIDRKVGFQAVAEQQMTQNPKAEERMASLTPEQRATNLRMTSSIMKVSSYSGVVFLMIFLAIEALILWVSFNFGLGAQTTFPRVFAVAAFAALPRGILQSLLSFILLSAGVGTENFNLQNPVGTNVGYYLTEAPKWMRTAGGFFDVLGIWSLILLVIGMAIISRKTIAQSATVVVGWWLLILLVSTGVAAAF